MNRVIARELELYVSEILKIKKYKKKDAEIEEKEKIKLGEEIEKMLKTKGWKEIEEMIIKKINENTLILMNGIIENTEINKSIYFVQGKIKAYVWLLNMIGFLIKKRFNQKAIDFMQGFNFALQSLIQEIRDKVKLSKILKRRQNEGREVQ